jgi:hypothetical protein
MSGRKCCLWNTHFSALNCKFHKPCSIMTICKNTAKFLIKIILQKIRVKTPNNKAFTAYLNLYWATQVLPVVLLRVIPYMFIVTITIGRLLHQFQHLHGENEKNTYRYHMSKMGRCYYHPTGCRESPGRHDQRRRQLLQRPGWGGCPLVLHHGTRGTKASV